MAAIVNGICQCIRTVNGVFRLFNDIHTFAKEEDDPLSRNMRIATIVMRQISLGLNVFADFANFGKAPGKILGTIKKIEHMTNLLKIIPETCLAIEDHNRNKINFRELIESGFISPCAELYRSSYEYQQHYYRHLLTLPSDELAEISEPIFDGERAVGQREVTREYCYERLRIVEAELPLVNCVEVAARTGSKNVEKVMINIYQSIIGEELRNVVNSNPATVTAEPVQAVNPLAGRLASLTFIPDELHKDLLFSKYICPITRMPIRDPVADPNGITIYERAGILGWLQNHNTSPVTREALTVQQLQERPGLKAFIDARLAFHDEQIQKAIEAGLIVTPATNLANAATK